MQDKIITILVDNESWITPYAKKLVDTLNKRGFYTHFAQHASEVRLGWINFILGCTKIISDEVLSRNQHNLVVHESNLPAGRGFSPMVWQILEGKKTIPICLLEAISAVDTGDVWIRDTIELDGYELSSEWRAAQGEKTLELCLRFIDQYKSLYPNKQQGKASWYERRYPENSRLDPDKTIREQFDLLRVADNEKYPAYFEISGQKYFLKIYKK